MVEDQPGAGLKPFDFTHILDHFPELGKLKTEVYVHAFEQPLDSSDVGPETWKTLTQIIVSEYNHYDGFVILHGTDTMAYSASALSFMLQGIQKPVVFTGSQLPISTLRTDGRENLIAAIEVAGHTDLHEVVICFGSVLLRGNRSVKANSEGFNAFASNNFPPLAEIGIHIQYNPSLFWNTPIEFTPQLELAQGVELIKIHPGMARQPFESRLHCPEIQGVILETFGSGTVPQQPWFFEAIQGAIERGVIFLNLSQCPHGGAEQTLYHNGRILEQLGVINGGDMTTEAALAKMMVLLSMHHGNPKLIQQKLKLSLSGELSPSLTNKM
jgi:L-asparaginase